MLFSYFLMSSSNRVMEAFFKGASKKDKLGRFFVSFESSW